MLVGKVMLTCIGHCTCVQEISTGTHREIMCAYMGNVRERYMYKCMVVNLCTKLLQGNIRERYMYEHAVAKPCTKLLYREICRRMLYKRKT